MPTTPAPGVAKETSKHPRPAKGFLINRNFRLLAIGGAFIALAGLFGWFALPKETYTSQKTK